MIAEIALLAGGLALCVLGAYGGGIVWTAVGLAFCVIALVLQHGRHRA